MPPPTSLYIHVPFRSDHRPYDDAAYDVVSPPARRTYVSALQTELRTYAVPRLSQTRVASVHFGGGRPSLLSLNDFRRLRDVLAPVFDENTEFAVEISPADATESYVKGLSSLGVTRLCVEGVSLSPATLRAVGSSHTADDVDHALSMARRFEFDTVGLDLLFGTESLSLDTWDATLRDAVSAGWPHISIIESPTASPDANATAAQMERALSLLTGAGYAHYSLTHFARPGHQPTHQTHYDQHASYLGVGPSAASFWRSPSAPNTHALRWSNVSALSDYGDRLAQGKAPFSGKEVLGPQALAREHLIIRLQTADGLKIAHLRETYGLDLQSSASALLARLRAHKLVADVPGWVRLTPKGRLRTDAITNRLLASL